MKWNEYFSIKTMSSGIRYLLQIDLKNTNLIDYQIEMINQNAKDSLVLIEKATVADNIQLQYDITGQQSLREYLSKNTLNKKFLLELLDNICQIILEGDNYFLNANNYFINLDYIFIDLKDNKVKMVYLPIEDSAEEDINRAFTVLLKEIIVDYAIMEETTIDNNLCYKIINATKEAEFSIENFKKKIKEMLNELDNEEIGNTQEQKIEEKIDNINSDNRVLESNQPQIKAVEVKPSVVTNQETVKPVEAQVKPNNVIQEKPINNQVKSNTISQPVKNVQAPINSVQNNNTSSQEYKMAYGAGTKIAVALIQVIVCIAIPLIMFGVQYLIPDINYFIQIGAIVLLVIIDIIITILLFNPKRKKKVAVKANKKVQAKVKTNQGYQKADTHIMNTNKEEAMSPPSVNLSKREIVTQLSYDTEVLESTIPYLLSTQSGTADKIYINKDSFKLGRLQEMSDCVVPAKAVGKVHAEIIKINSDYYIKDLESKNGTFINGNKLVPGEQVLLKDDDLVVLANVSFKFKEM